MKKSKGEEKKTRRVTHKIVSRSATSSAPSQPSSSHSPTKKKIEKKICGKHCCNNHSGLEQFVHKLVSDSALADDIEQCVGEYVNPFHNITDDNDGKLYVCPGISDEILPKNDWFDKLQEYIMIVLDSDPIQAAILSVKSLNSKDEAEECFSVIERYLKNIIENPENEKYRYIRCNNPIVQSKVLDTEGALLFLATVGFTLEAKNEHSDGYLSFEGSHYHLKEVIKLMKDVEGFRLKPLEDYGEIDEGLTCSDGSREGTDEFYKLTSTDLKKNQKLRELEIEKESQLRTKSMREKEKRLVPKSKSTKIRIRTPEGKLFESTFEITEKLLQVYKFIEENVAKGKSYTLFMPPATPFQDKDKERTLVDLQLFPAVLLTLKWAQVEKKNSKGKK